MRSPVRACSLSDIQKDFNGLSSVIFVSVRSERNLLGARVLNKVESEKSALLSYVIKRVFCALEGIMYINVLIIFHVNVIHGLS